MEDEWEDLQAQRTGNSGWRACSLRSAKNVRPSEAKGMRRIRYQVRNRETFSVANFGRVDSQRDLKEARLSSSTERKGRLRRPLGMRSGEWLV